MQSSMALRIISILVIGMTTNVYIPVAPSILGAMVDYQGFSISDAGRLVSFIFWGTTVGTVLAILILHRPGWNLRLTMLVCMLLVIISSAANVWLVENINALAAVRFAIGLGGGLGFTVGAVALIGTPHAERSYAIHYGSAFVISGVGLAFLPYVYTSFGIEGAYYGFSAINILALGLLPFFPRTVTGLDPADETRTASRDPQAALLVSILLAALFLHFVCNSGIWAYFERIGVAYGMSSETAGAILGPSMSAAAIGMIAATILGDRLGYLWPIYIGTFIIALATLLLLFSSSPVVFGIGTGIFNAAITFVSPYFIAFLALLIPSGFGVSAGNIAIQAGFSTGPFVLSFLIVGEDFRSSILMTSGGFLVVIVLVYLFSRGLQQGAAGRERVLELCEVPRGQHPS